MSEEESKVRAFAAEALREMSGQQPTDAIVEQVTAALVKNLRRVYEGT